tara:strand:- start:406 stop:594 length:189 start_codon:yes stop_codon:yes gene_type:complete
MVYLLKCLNDKETIMRVSPGTDYLEISIEEIGSGAELQIYLSNKDVFDLIGILHHIQKNMSK